MLYALISAFKTILFINDKSMHEVQF